MEYDSRYFPDIFIYDLYIHISYNINYYIKFIYIYTYLFLFGHFGCKLHHVMQLKNPAYIKTKPYQTKPN